MITLEKYQKLKGKIEAYKKQVNQGEGMLKSLMGRLLQEFDCRVLEEGEILLLNLQRENQESLESLEREIKELREEYPEVLGE